MNPKHVWKAGMAGAVLLMTVVAGTARADETFTFDDIHYWIGEGTNQAALVIDWNNGRPDASLAWGVRWNGISTNLTEWVRRLAHEDRRLHAVLVDGSYGAWLLGMGYDADDDGGSFNSVSPGVATDADDFIAMDDFSSSHYWSVVTTNRPALSSGGTWAYTSTGVDGLFPVDQDWYAFKRVNWMTGESSDPGWLCAAESPYAVAVVDSRCDPDEVRFVNPAAVLGPPSRMTGVDDYDSVTRAPVSPVTPAMNESQLFALSWTEDAYTDEPGFITVAFDHRVMDDPQNPYGLDLIVFGNVLQDIAAGTVTGHEDPASVVVQSASLLEEPGVVEVSQDGVTWHAFTDGPFADSFAPTMGHLYETNAPDAGLFEGNAWWGRPTDPMLPIDPALTSADFAGRTLADYAVLYNGSAGGTGFDIGGLPLPVDPGTGLKWIRYVRVWGGSNIDDAEWTDIDAFADVAPAQSYDNWARAHYAWTELPDSAIAGKAALAANGKPNVYNAAFGTGPDETPVENFAIADFSVDGDRIVFHVFPAAKAHETFRVSRAQFADSRYKDQWPVYEGETPTVKGQASVFSIPLDETVESAFFKIGVSAQ